MQDEQDLDAALEALEQTPVEWKARVPCRVATILSELPEATREKLRRLIDDPKRPMTEIAGVLTNHGYPISVNTIGRHRRRHRAGSGCRCPL